MFSFVTFEGRTLFPAVLAGFSEVIGHGGKQKKFQFWELFDEIGVWILTV